jgi:hypothetical protein
MSTSTQNNMEESMLVVFKKHVAEECQRIIDRSYNDPLGTSKVIDMRNIAKSLLESATK